MEPSPEQKEDLPLPTGESPFGPSSLVASTDDQNKQTKKQGELPPPPGFGRLALQLFLIPAIICSLAIGSMLLIYKLMHRADSLETVMVRLRTSSGAGQLSVGINDPRYQDRCRAAMTLAEKLPQIIKDGKRDEIGQQLIAILESSVAPTETRLRIYLMLAIGRLGPEGANTLFSVALTDEDQRIQQAAATSIAALPRNRQIQSRELLPVMGLELENAVARGESDPLDTSLACELVRVMGILLGHQRHLDALEQSSITQQKAISQLRRVFNDRENAHRDVIWNAAIALARLGDEAASALIADLLLNREALAKIEMPTRQQFVNAKGQAQTRTANMTPEMQTQIIASVLTAVADSPEMSQTETNSGKSPKEMKNRQWRLNMTSPLIWAKIGTLAESDSNRYIKVRAQELLQSKKLMEN